ncbi:bifunctional 2-C-methyl-D-erythritol 4-phosphate cytidylyltransferase/2-C-methyl-D-erythritol 2,4-cyclodiphosphate synthase [Curvivirga aplysinae]|uniref:bifunctional 2-C-methyl-D-erythritol 4-phosphate cytidylyltransferase/2-C-methyl-D-erythritol 2,4-cyclodiphosphate synthase n=1 Tax=Curvivirga aplysinae TaxID=2529852 RepID=UPI0012BD20C4|nr:bifunctional 2-C-methyl-D-erythritol 4-phosphate cytidylyltransferase/2-C-methyl-D-erythritol 2,4-cyclodiphosphate synthase [Curvivirga aplysinae]MTI10069.1 bifunctional 2-C-methyl-D-erythritol 4-phosphate cytidylyltransferase/2-C-methyl-D-erythritol 2,4-cyclodiphosphate synthase [Curvivirga aplysinae]
MKNSIDIKKIALIVAAGRGYRAGGDIPKQYRLIAKKSLIRYAAEVFTHSAEIDDLYIVIHPNDEKLYTNALYGLNYKVISGGNERQDSVRLGLKAISDKYSSDDLVFIHDAARPFLSEELISDCIQALNSKDVDGIIPALEVVDTVKRVDENAIINETVDRSVLRNVQTPQVFPLSKILDAHLKAEGKKLTDDASVAEAAGLRLKCIQGSVDNFKVTRPEDFTAAERKLSEIEMKTPRMATGFDVHAFEEGDHVTLCGVNIPHTQKLKGHSDADVAMHALTDALLGCISAGDIGTHFPPSEPQWKGAASHIFLKHARELIVKEGGEIQHVDVTIICEAPKVGKHKDAMREKLAKLLRLDVKRVSVKATTTEKLGFTGRQEGIAAQAAATILV